MRTRYSLLLLLVVWISFTFFTLPQGVVRLGADETYKARIASQTEKQRNSKFLRGAMEFHIVKIIDADTYSGDVFPWFSQSNRVRVRLRGVDTPEPRGACQAEKDLAKRGTKFVRQWFATNKSVELVNMEKGKYGRVVADVRNAHGNLLSKILLEQGLGRPYQGGRRTGWCGV